MSDKQVTSPWYAVDEVGNDNFATSIYEQGHKGLLVARCNQNGQYPWQAQAIIRGLERNKSRDAALATAASQQAEVERLREALREALCYVEFDENEIGATLATGNTIRAALAHRTETPLPPMEPTP